MRKQSLVLGVAVLLISGGIASAQIAVPPGQDNPVRSGFQNGAHAGSAAGICSECYALIHSVNRTPEGLEWWGRSLSRRDRHHGSGDVQARCQTCGQIPATDVLLRGGADGIRALSADQEAWPRLHRGGTLAHPRRNLAIG
jgi:hypothetical protein